MNSYYDIAIDDYKTALAVNIVDDNYNATTNIYCNMIEKLLKSVLEVCPGNYDKLLHSHNLVTIYTEILSAGVDLNIRQDMLYVIRGYYFNVRYPGDDYVKVSRKHFDECVTFAKEVLVSVNAFRQQRGLPTCGEVCVAHEIDTDEIWHEYCEHYAIRAEQEPKELARLIQLYDLIGIDLFEKIKDDLL